MPAYSLVIGIVGLTAALGMRGLQPAPTAPASMESAGGSAKGSVAILPTGSLHGDEVPHDAAGDWFALVSEVTGVSLRPVSVSLLPEQDMMDRDGEETGRRVEVSPPLDPIVLVRGLPSFTGHVTTALIGQSIDVGPGVEARLNNVSSRLWLRCSEGPAVQGERQQRCALTLQSDSRRQTLFTYTAWIRRAEGIWPAERPPLVLWAGDLDLDGNLDILLDTSEHWNVTDTRLFLSSAAGGDQLVSDVAGFRSTGC
jgi:hypothetical protein